MAQANFLNHDKLEIPSPNVTMSDMPYVQGWRQAAQDFSGVINSYAPKPVNTEAAFQQAQNLIRSYYRSPNYEPPQVPYSPDVEKTRSTLYEMIRDGLTTNVPGRRLTADGLNAITNTIRELDAAENNRFSTLAQYNANLQGQDTQRQNAILNATTNTFNSNVSAQDNFNANRINTLGTILQALTGNAQTAERYAATLDTNNSRLRSAELTNQANMASVQGSLAQAMVTVNRNLYDAIQQYVYQGQSPDAILPDQRPQIQARMQAAQLALPIASNPEALAAFQQNFAKLRERALTDPNARAELERQIPIFNALMVLAPYAQVRAYLEKAMNNSQVPGYANGGIVTSNLSNGGGVPADAIQRYQVYINTVRQLGLNPVPFQTFLQATTQQPPVPTQQPAAPQLQAASIPGNKILGYAKGGVVSMSMRDPTDASGKMVIDLNPNSPTDSIPAVVDGIQPAKLDSGEIVFPKEAVMFYGIERLMRMIQKAREGLGATVQ